MVIVIKNFSKTYGTKELFSQVNLTIHDKERIALLGQNGTGKSTFVKCLIGDEDYDGSIVLGSLKVSSMEQERSFEKVNQNFTEYLKEKKQKIDKLKTEIEEKMGDPAVYDNMDQYSKILSHYEALCARTIENIEEVKIKSFLAELEFELEDYEKPIIALSGGQRTKLRLAECLSREADLLVLDEPTNHLDFKTRKWLENYLLELGKTLLVISHDRFFIDRIVNRIIEVENKTLVSYDVNYSSYLELKKKHIQELQKQFEDIAREKARLTESMKEKIEWMKKNKSRKLKIQVDHLKKRIDELPKLENPEKFNEVYDLKFRAGTRTPNVLFTGTVTKSFGEFVVLDKAEIEINSGDRIAIIGPNGSGKSTLLKILAGKLDNQSNLTADPSIKIGYFDQEFANMDPNKRVMGYIQESHFGEDHHLIAYLIRFGFDKDRMRNRLKTLSGGEKARLALAKLMLSKFNLLLLDEPTNNLDLELMEVLESALKDYFGTVVFVSHDRYFIEKVATKMFFIEDKKIQIIQGHQID